MGPSRGPDHLATEGDWTAPIPFASPAAFPPFFFSAKKASQKIIIYISQKIGVRFEMFAILANADLNLKLKNCKIAI